MADPVLIVASGYDAATFHTRGWAHNLRNELLRRKHICLMLEAENLCLAGDTFQRAIDCVAFVVFYGHGTANQWTAIPAGAHNTAISLVDVATVQTYNGRKVYAGCCDSLGPRGSGSALGHQYKAAFPNGSFIGYHAKFQVEFSNHKEFGDVVNSSVVNYVSGDSAQKVANDLATEWNNLRDAFANGRLKNRPNAIMAAQLADNNGRHVGYV
jgi:hypothetical protein